MSTNNRLLKKLILSSFILIQMLFVCTHSGMANDSNLDLPKEIQSNSYHLSTGDKLRIQVFNEDDLKLETLIGEEGNISYPFLGDVKVNGLTIPELEAKIAKGLRGSYLVNPIVNVSILEYRAFFINGEVKSPGGYPYQPGLTLRKAIALAGGTTPRASLELATITREKNPKESEIEMNFDSVINPGDIITIIAYKKIFIDGEVRRPGSFDYQPGLTLQKVISLAGGFTERAAKESILVVRESDINGTPIEAKLNDLVSPGDIITIEQSFF